MYDRRKEFFKNLVINEQEKKKADKAIASKGIEIHILIKNKLLPWSRNGKIQYCEIASTYRYDKRIRKVLFKYISYLEELYRGILLDNFYNNINQKFWISEVKAKINKYEFREALEKLTFRQLVYQMNKIPSDLRLKSLFCNLNEEITLIDNINALIDLRNNVMHNKFLLLYNDYLPCTLNQITKSNLIYNINNLRAFLPKNVGNNLILEINDCVKNRNTSNDVKWKLPKHIIMEL